MGDGRERGNILDTLGWTWYRRGDIHKAQKYLQQAVDLFGYDLMIRHHLETVEDLLKADEVRV